METQTGTKDVQPGGFRPEAWIFGLSMLSMVVLVLAPHRIGLGLGF